MQPIARLRKQMAGAEVREGRWTMLLKSCRCGKLIPQSIKMCEECAKRQQENKAGQQSRYVVYNNTKRNQKTAEFYLSREWRALRPVIKSVYGYMDIYALYVLKEIKTLEEFDPIHHIVELDEDWEQRLNPLNLIPLKKETHSIITALYKKSKESMKATQTQLRALIEYHFREAGGYEKVLSDAFLVTPPSNLWRKLPTGNSVSKVCWRECQNVAQKG